MREKIREIFVVFGAILVVISFIIPVYYLKWYEILVLHCSCVLITFILSKTVNSRKFSEPDNIYQFTFFLGLAGLITNLISWKKSNVYNSKSSIQKSLKSENKVHKTIKSNSIDHISIMYYLREKLKTSTEKAVFESTKQELINLIKKHSPKDSSGNYVSISFLKEDTDHLDGILLSEIEKMQFDKFNSKYSNSEEELINKLTEFLTKEIHKTRENDSNSSPESEGIDEVNSERNKIDQTLTEDQNRWITLVDHRVKSMPLETLKKLGDTVDIIANDHLLEYKANEPNIPKDIRKKVAKERVQGLLSIKDYVLKNGDEEQIFHLESSLKAAELYASTLGLNNINLNHIKNNSKTHEISQNDNKEDLNKVTKIQSEGLEFDEIEVGIGVYDYLSYHNNGEKYIEFKSSIFKELEWHFNSDISDEFEMDDSSELNVYNKNGESINMFTVFLCPNKSYETVIIFEVNKNDLLEMENWLFTSIESIKSLLTNKSHFVNCVNGKINLEQAPSVLLNSSSQDVLGYLANYVPEKEFVLLRRWEDGNDFCDEVYVTCSNSKKYRNDKELKKFPGSKNVNEYISEGKYNEPDYFYVYEKHVFVSLEFQEDRLKLEVDNYKTNPLI